MLPLGVDLAGQNGPNPAPPIGLTPCGKTMCNKDETCMKYPQDVDEHCVPNKLLPSLPPVAPQDLPPGMNLCSEGTGVFPPNSSCFNNIKNTQEQIKDYQKTCIYEPVVEYKGDRGPTGDMFPNQPYTQCGKGYAGPDPGAPEAPGSIDKYDCAVNMLVYTDVRDAELGGYGPTVEERTEKGTDFTAQNYLYSALFDKPLDLTKPTAFGVKSIDNPLNNREASRTYWRLMSASVQANLRSYTLNMAYNKQINDIEYKFTDTNSLEDKTTLIELYNALKTQVIVFLHFPFIRVGCLTDYPVCPEYAQAIKQLKPPTQDITDFLTQAAAQTPIGKSLLTNIAIPLYESTLKRFHNDMDGPYSAFVPLDFDSVRSYILKKKDEDEFQMYNWTNYHTNMLVNSPNQERYGTLKPLLTNVSRENIPYLGAIYQGLLSPKFGLLSALQPSWLFDIATKSGNLSDYKIKDDNGIQNQPQDFPEVKIAKQNLLSFLTDQIGNTPLEIISNTAGWVYNQVKDLFTSEENTKLKGYTKKDEDLTIQRIRQAYVDFKSCPLPVSYHLLSPKTGPAKSPIPPGSEELPKYGDHHQIVTIWGPQVQWSWSPKKLFDIEQCVYDRLEKGTGKECSCPNNTQQFQENGSCWKRHWTVSGTVHGKALTVLNNPKATDVKNAIVQSSNFSLSKTLLPDAVNKKKITDASIDAPYAANYSAYQDKGATKTSTAPNGTQKVLNEVEPINRINNRAQDTMHLLQNCWTVPEKLQNSPRCKLALVASSSAETKCTGEAFRKIDPNPTPLGAKGQAVFSSVRGQISDEAMTAYAEAEKATGVPCEVLAGIHYREADNNLDQDLQSGAPLAGRSLAESAVQAATELLGKAGGSINSLDDLIQALSWYNGGGNSNCQAQNSYNCPAANGDVCGSTLNCSHTNLAACTCDNSPSGAASGSCRALCTAGFPYLIPSPPAGLCSSPLTGRGFDDPYVTELWQSPLHDNMYILYKYDCTASAPEQQNRLGTLTTAIGLFYDLHGSNTTPETGR